MPLPITYQVSLGGHYQDGRGWGPSHQLTHEASPQVAQGLARQGPVPILGAEPCPYGAPCHPSLPSMAVDAPPRFAAVSSLHSQSCFAGRGSIPSLLSGRRPSSPPLAWVSRRERGAGGWDKGCLFSWAPGLCRNALIAAGTKAASVRCCAGLC